MDTLILMPDWLDTALLSNRPAPAHVYVAYSGGVDSLVLLHLVAQRADWRGKLTAVHVHHGLQAQADLWAQHCQATAAGLEVGFRLLKVTAKAQPGQSPEAAAREARYSALRGLLAAGEIILVAQHREDQLETVLLQLFRGGGLRGLSGMPAVMRFGAGELLRPLLAARKAEVLAYAATQGLQWVEDPSNANQDFDRNFLRQSIIPTLKQRWPGLDKTVARSAQHCAEAEQLLAELTAQPLAQLITADQTLDIPGLLTFDTRLQKALLRQWLAGLGLKAPSQAMLARIQTDLLAARADANPCVSLPHHELRRYQDRLYCLPLPPPVLQTGRWPPEAQQVPISAYHQLQLLPSDQGLAKTRWSAAAEITLRARHGGEKIRLPHRQGQHRLKNLCQEAGIPPWERTWLPLIFIDGQLAAVGHRWIAAEFFCQQPGGCFKLVLSKHTT